MSAPTRPETTARHALWLGGLLVTLAALFGMHGLDSHGVAGADTIAHAVMTGPGAVAVAVGHDKTPMALVEARAAVSMAAASMAPGDVVTGHGGMTGGMAGGCMAVLVVALMALVRRLGNARGRPLCRLAAHPARAPGIHARDPDPPSPITLSIQRC